MKAEDNEEAVLKRLKMDQMQQGEREKGLGTLFPGLMSRWTVASITNNESEKDVMGDEFGFSHV